MLYILQKMQVWGCPFLSEGKQNIIQKRNDAFPFVAVIFWYITLLSNLMFRAQSKCAQMITLIGLCLISYEC